MAWECPGCTSQTDMYTDSGSSEMGCAAILMAQHTHVWAPMRRLGVILSHSRGAESLSEAVLGVFGVVLWHRNALAAYPTRLVYRLWQQ